MLLALLWQRFWLSILLESSGLQKWFPTGLHMVREMLTFLELLENGTQLIQPEFLVIIFSDNRNWLESLIPIIRDFLAVKLKLELHPEQGGKLQEYQRYKDSEDGISPRIIPGTPGFHFQVNSYEHIPDGHTTEDAAVRIMQVNKRFRKQTTYLRDDFQMPKTYGYDEADVAIVAWGTTKLPVLEALVYRDWKVNDKKIKLIHFTHMWPMDGDRVKEILEKEKQLVLIENNSQAQFGQLIRQETGIKIEKRLLKYDGRPIYPEEVVEFLSHNM